MFDLLGTKGKKGSGNKFLRACHHCGKTGHKAAECWAKHGQPGQAPSYLKGTYGKGPGNMNTTSNSGKVGKEFKGGSKGSRGKNGSKGKKGKSSGKKGKGKATWKKAKRPKKPMAASNLGSTRGRRSMGKTVS